MYMCMQKLSVYFFLNMYPFGEWGGLTRKPVIETSYMTIVTSNHHDKSDSYRCVIECFRASSCYFDLFAVIRIF